jgi:hypothetical protein
LQQTWNKQYVERVARRRLSSSPASPTDDPPEFDAGKFFFYVLNTVAGTFIYITDSLLCDYKRPHQRSAFAAPAPQSFAASPNRVQRRSQAPAKAFVHALEFWRLRV